MSKFNCVAISRGYLEDNLLDVLSWARENTIYPEECGEVIKARQELDLLMDMELAWGIAVPE